MNQICIKQQYIQHPEGQVFVKAWICKDTQLAAIILLHESLGSVAQWKGFPEELARATGRSVLAYDRIGFGQSSGCTQILQTDFLHTESATIAIILELFDISKFIVFGHSVGAGFAVGCALDFPNCLALIIESALAYTDQKTIQGLTNAKLAFQDSKLFSRLSYYHGDKAQSVLDAWLNSWLSEEFKSWSIVNQLAQIKAPVMIIHAENDEYAEQAQAQTILKSINSDCRLELIRDCGHIPHHEKMQLVVGHLQAFLQKLA